MGFIAPKIKVATPPPPPPAPLPDPAPKVEQIEQETLVDVSEKQKQRKGLQNTLLSSPKIASSPFASSTDSTYRTTLG